MPAKTDDLLAAMTRLEKTLAGDAAGKGNEWMARVDGALAAVEQAVRQHGAALESPDGRLLDIDRPRLPSPTVTRRIAALRRELDSFLKEAGALRTKLRQSLAAVTAPEHPENLAATLAVAPELGARPDFAVFYRRAAELAHALQHYEDEEADLILDSTNTDIGAGD